MKKFIDLLRFSAPLFLMSRHALAFVQLHQQYSPRIVQVWQNVATAGHETETKVKKTDKKAKQRKRFVISSVEDLNDYFDDSERRFRKRNGEINYDSLLEHLHVIGDTQCIGSPQLPDAVHPVLKLLHERRKRKYQKGDDPFKVALAIEGGGMRGCVSAGMVAAIHYLGLEDSFDVVYGSSAGTVIGSYFITGQLPWFGPEIYYDSLTTAGKSFIDTKRLLRAIGFGLLHPLLLKDVIFRPHHGKPVLNLEYLLQKTMQEKKPLQWEKFVEMQKVRPLKIVASGLESEKAVVMDYDKESFSSLAEMARCMQASCLLPGIAGPVMNIDKRALNGTFSKSVNGSSNSPKVIVKNGLASKKYEPVVDALVYEPIPYRSAVGEGATHVLVLRTRPDGTDVTGKSSFFERLIFRRFFLRKNKLPRIFKYMRMQFHKKLYAEDVLILNKAAKDMRDYQDTSKPHLMTIAVPPGSDEVTRLETDRRAIFEGVRRGFARTFDALVEDPEQRGRGEELAKQYFPEEILDYDPLEIPTSSGNSAFTLYLQEMIRESSVKIPDHWGKTASELNGKHSSPKEKIE